MHSNAREIFCWNIVLEEMLERQDRIRPPNVGWMEYVEILYAVYNFLYWCCMYSKHKNLTTFSFFATFTSFIKTKKGLVCYTHMCELSDTLAQISLYLFQLPLTSSFYWYLCLIQLKSTMTTTPKLSVKLQNCKPLLRPFFIAAY